MKVYFSYLIMFMLSEEFVIQMKEYFKESAQTSYVELGKDIIVLQSIALQINERLFIINIIKIILL
jgi:hypothetical protein